MTQIIQKQQQNKENKERLNNKHLQLQIKKDHHFYNEFFPFQILLNLIYSLQEQQQYPKYQKYEDIQQYAKENNICPYYIAYTDDLQTDYEYFYQGLDAQIFYVKSYNNEFVAFIDEHIIHFRGDITRKHIEKFISLNSILKCRNPVFTQFKQIQDFKGNISLIYTETINQTVIDTISQLTSKDNLQIGITNISYKNFNQDENEAQKDQNLWGNDILIVKLTDKMNQNPKIFYIHANIFEDSNIDFIEQKISEFFEPKHVNLKDVKPQNQNQNYFYWKSYNDRLNAGLVLKNENDDDINEMVEQKSQFSKEMRNRRNQDDLIKFKQELKDQK